MVFVYSQQCFDTYHFFLIFHPVVYDGCPRSSSEGIWWPRTVFDSEAIENCPKTTVGKASRSCDNDLGGWQEADMFNCTSDRFMELRQEVRLTEIPSQ